MTNEWIRPEHAAAYLARKDEIPHRAEGEATLLSEVSPACQRVLDLGCGDGHMLRLLRQHCPEAECVGLDFSPTMLTAATRHFQHDHRVRFLSHSLDDHLPDLGTFDCIVSSFAIHHCTDPRKRELSAEIFDALDPGGLFCNLEHVASPNPRVHARFVAAMRMTPADEDPSNQLLDVETQLQWLRDCGFDDVDCYWKWRELALLIGRRPATA